MKTYVGHGRACADPRRLSLCGPLVSLQEPVQCQWLVTLPERMSQRAHPGPGGQNSVQRPRCGGLLVPCARAAKVASGLAGFLSIVLPPPLPASPPLFLHPHLLSGALLSTLTLSFLRHPSYHHCRPLSSHATLVISSSTAISTRRNTATRSIATLHLRPVLHQKQLPDEASPTHRRCLNHPHLPVTARAPPCRAHPNTSSQIKVRRTGPRRTPHVARYVAAQRHARPASLSRE